MINYAASGVAERRLADGAAITLRAQHLRDFVVAETVPSGYVVAVAALATGVSLLR